MNLLVNIPSILSFRTFLIYILSKGANFSVALDGYTAQFKLRRKLLSPALTPRVVRESYRTLQEEEIHGLLKCFLNNPDNFLADLCMYVQNYEVSIFD